MKKKVALAAMILAALTAAPIASADTPICVTRGEFSRIHKGDALNRVARIFDRRGKQVSISVYGGYKSQIRQYRDLPEVLAGAGQLQQDAGHAVRDGRQVRHLGLTPPD